MTESYDLLANKIFVEFTGDIARYVSAIPSSALAGIGLLLMLFGKKMASVVIMLAGIVLGAMPAYYMWALNRASDIAVGDTLIPRGSVALVLVIGAFCGGYIAFSAHKAIRFIVVGAAWLALLLYIWPNGYAYVSGNVVALAGFFVFGYFHEHLFIIATSVLGAILVVVSLNKILMTNYPEAGKFIGSHPAVLFSAMGVLAFTGAFVQLKLTSKGGAKKSRVGREKESAKEPVSEKNPAKFQPKPT
jgi:hypothetical protein